MKKLVFIIIASLAIMACEDNNKAENSNNKFEGINLDSVDIAIIDDEPADYYDSIQQKWIGPHADRLNGVDTSYIEGI